MSMSYPCLEIFTFPTKKKKKKKKLPTPGNYWSMGRKLYLSTLKFKMLNAGVADLFELPKYNFIPIMFI